MPETEPALFLFSSFSTETFMCVRQLIFRPPPKQTMYTGPVCGVTAQTVKVHCSAPDSGRKTNTPENDSHARQSAWLHGAVQPAQNMQIT